MREPGWLRWTVMELVTCHVSRHRLHHAAVLPQLALQLVQLPQEPGVGPHVPMLPHLHNMQHNYFLNLPNNFPTLESASPADMWCLSMR